MIGRDVFYEIMTVYPAGILAQQYHHMNGGMHFWYWGLGIILILLFIAGVVMLVYYSAHRSRKINKGNQQQETPLDILQKRFARGEISKEQFDRMKKEL